MHPAGCERAWADWPAHSRIPDGSFRHPVRSPATPAAKHRFSQLASLLPESGTDSIDDARRGSSLITDPAGETYPMHNGDCKVTVATLLAVAVGWLAMVDLRVRELVETNRRQSGRGSCKEAQEQAGGSGRRRAFSRPLQHRRCAANDSVTLPIFRAQSARCPWWPNPRLAAYSPCGLI
jgi:hypothetical protein